MSHDNRWTGLGVQTYTMHESDLNSPEFYKTCNATHKIHLTATESNLIYRL